MVCKEYLQADVPPLSRLIIPSMFISSKWGVKKPTLYSRKVGHEVRGVAAVFCECTGGYREVIYLARDIKSHSNITLHF